RRARGAARARVGDRLGEGAHQHTLAGSRPLPGDHYDAVETEPRISAERGRRGAVFEHLRRRSHTGGYTAVTAAGGADEIFHLSARALLVRDGLGRISAARPHHPQRRYLRQDRGISPGRCAATGVWVGRWTIDDRRWTDES